MNTSKHELVSPKSPDPIIVTRALIKRAWSDIEPKIASALASGAVSTGLVITLESYGIHLPLPLLSGLPVFCTILAGYLTPSVGTVTTVRTGDGLVVEKHSGNTEIRTGAIPIQNPYTPPVSRGTYATTLPPVQVPTPEPTTPPSDPQPYEVPDSVEDQSFTQVLEPESSRANAFLSHLPSSGGNRAAFYENDNH